MKQEVWRRIDELSGELWELALKIHENPELGFAEHKAATWLTQALEEGGFQVELGVGNLPTAFRALVGLHNRKSGAGWPTMGKTPSPGRPSLGDQMKNPTMRSNPTTQRQLSMVTAF
jgi:hypothetical protein